MNTPAGAQLISYRESSIAGLHKVTQVLLIQREGEEKQQDCSREATDSGRRCTSLTEGSPGNEGECGRADELTSQP